MEDPPKGWFQPHGPPSAIQTPGRGHSVLTLQGPPAQPWPQLLFGLPGKFPLTLHRPDPCFFIFSWLLVNLLTAQLSPLTYSSSSLILHAPLLVHMGAQLKGTE